MVLIGHRDHEESDGVVNALRSRKKSLPVSWTTTRGGRPGWDLVTWLKCTKVPTDTELREAATLVEQGGGREWAVSEARRRAHLGNQALCVGVDTSTIRIRTYGARGVHCGKASVMDLPSEICVLPRLTTPETVGDPTVSGVAREALNSIAGATTPLDGAMTVSEATPDSAVGVGVGRACGKVILIGEHVVVYGLPAIAVPLPDLTIEATVRFATFRAVSGGPFTPRTDAAEHRLVYTPHAVAEGTNSSLAVAVEAAMHRWQIADETVEVRLTSHVPPGRGLGFSAACATAAVRALADLVNAPLDDRALKELVQGSEQIAHGQASGVDAAAVAVTTPIRFEAGVVRPIAIDHDVALVVADTGCSGSTRQSVAFVRYALLHNPSWAEQRLARAAAVIESAETSLLNGRLAALGRQLNEFHSLLDEFGVSSAEIERLVETALAAGAYGAKLTGGGIGGCVIALTEPSYAATVRAALTAAGATQTWIVSTRDWASCAT